MSSNLKQARLDLGLSIEEIAESLKIRKKYLIALEEERYDILPGNAYVIGYLKSYSKFLKIEIENIDITAEDKIKIANIEIKNSKTQNYLVIISIFVLAIIGVVYYQIFSTADNEMDEEVIVTYPNVISNTPNTDSNTGSDSEQLNVNDKHE